MQSIITMSGELGDELVALRRDLHRHPEVGLQLPLTQAIILERISRLPDLEVAIGEELSSVTVVLRGARPPGEAPVVLLRGDMDALPIQEASGVGYSSEISGRMHACGHDLHSAALFGALRLLHAHRDRLAGDVIFMFQPGEEGHGGARLQIAEGVLDAAGRPIDAAFALHVVSRDYETGVFYGKGGTIMASSDGIEIEIQGESGHGSTPHLAQDPVPVACELVLALQSAVTRGFDVFDPVVVTVGQVLAGASPNSIPSSVKLLLTVRALSPESRRRALEIVRRTADHVARAHGLRAGIAEIGANLPATVNDVAEFEFAREVIASHYGRASFAEMEHPHLSAEDFSEVLARVPGAYLFIGAADMDPALSPTGHSELSRFDDSILPKAASALALLAFERLRR